MAEKHTAVKILVQTHIGNFRDTCIVKQRRWSSFQSSDVLVVLNFI